MVADSGPLIALASRTPDMIVSSNIVCYSHLAVGAPFRVTHWIMPLEERPTAENLDKSATFVQ